MAFDWKGTVGQVAPLLAGLLGTPAAGIAVAGLCHAAGLEPSPENAQAAAEQVAAGTMTGDQLIALKKAEGDASAQLKKMGYDFDMDQQKLVASDRADARDRQKVLKDKTPQILVFMALAAWALMNGTLLVATLKGHSLPTDMVGIIMRALGTMDALLGTGFAYFLGAGPHDAATREMLYNSTPTDGAAK